MFSTTNQAIADRLKKLSANGDPLARLNEIMDWELFIPLLERTFKKERKSLAGRKRYHLLVIFKVLILQCLYNLSDHQAEYQTRDRLSFMRFLGLTIHDAVPDEKTIWLFREALIKANAIEGLFQQFNAYLGEQGYAAAIGTMVDASIVSTPKQRNSRDDNKVIKEGKIPESFFENEQQLEEKGYESRIISRNKKHLPPWSDKARENTRRSKIRVRVEHVFGFMKNSMQVELVRGIGIVRVSAKLGLINLVYNFCRFEQLNRLGVV